MTAAKNRAVADLIGGGSVSFEEIEEDSNHTELTTTQQTKPPAKQLAGQPTLR
ncbi:MAG TPA: hypothetical protein VFE98_10950 [Candidatus Bathyarchaeia archaeon]|nr:hypothetical protein [Candidatus Bathyarchaeia archaeon]